MDKKAPIAVIIPSIRKRDSYFQSQNIAKKQEFIISVSVIYRNGYEHLQSYLGSTINKGDTSA